MFSNVFHHFIVLITLDKCGLWLERLVSSYVLVILNLRTFFLDDNCLAKSLKIFSNFFRNFHMISNISTLSVVSITLYLIISPLVNRAAILL